MLKYFLPIFLLTFAVFFAFAAVKYGPSVPKKTEQAAGWAVQTKPVASFINFIFSR